MNKLIGGGFAVTAVLAAALAFATSNARAVEPGQAAPVNLERLQGKLVYVDFWASWCGPCRQSFPWMNEMQAKYGPRGLQVVGVNLDNDSAEATKFLSQVPASFAVAFDPKGDTARRYQVKGMPSSVLIGPDGKVIQVHTGFRADQRAALEAAIVAALPVVR
jgi:thiol-disulfide isomerase/thioredoxin